MSSVKLLLAVVLCSVVILTVAGGS